MGQNMYMRMCVYVYNKVYCISEVKENFENFVL